MKNLGGVVVIDLMEVTQIRALDLMAFLDQL
jgi:hypothetical protein